MVRKLACGLAFTAASFGVAAIGTSQQQECFNEEANDYGVETISELPDKVIDDSGCVSWANTLGSLGVASGLVTVGYIVYDERRQSRATHPEVVSLSSIDSLIQPRHIPSRD